MLKICLDYNLTKETPYLAFPGTLWVALSGLFGVKIPQDIDSVLDVALIGELWVPIMNMKTVAMLYWISSYQKYAHVPYLVMFCCGLV